MYIQKKRKKETTIMLNMKIQIYTIKMHFNELNKPIYIFFILYKTFDTYYV